MFWEQVCASLRLLLFFNTSPLTVGFFSSFLSASLLSVYKTSLSSLLCSKLYRRDRKGPPPLPVTDTPCAATYSTAGSPATTLLRAMKTVARSEPGLHPQTRLQGGQ